MKRKIYHVGNEENKAPHNKRKEVRIEQKAAFSYWFKCWTDAYFIKDMQQAETKARFSDDIAYLKLSLAAFYSDYSVIDLSTGIQLMRALLLILETPKPTASDVCFLLSTLNIFCASPISDTMSDYTYNACALIVAMTILIHGKNELSVSGMSLKSWRLHVCDKAKKMTQYSPDESAKLLDGVERRFFSVLRDMLPSIAPAPILTYHFGDLGTLSVSIT